VNKHFADQNYLKFQQRNEVFNMALITRLSRLFQADFHAVLDRIEEPDIQLKQAVREMEFDLQQDEQALALLQHESEQLVVSIDETKAKIDAFDEELDLCFTAKKDDLARDLIRRKLEAETFLQDNEKRLNGINVSTEKLQQRIKQHRHQLDNMQQKLALLVEENTVGGYAEKPGVNIRTEDIEIAYLREKQKRAAS
jgi:phage shock protein A